MSSFTNIQKNKKEIDAVQEAIDALSKARRKLSDEYDPNEDPHDEENDPDLAGLREFDPDDESESEDWLKENDPSHGKKDQYEEYSDDEDELAHQKGIEDDLGEEPKIEEQPKVAEQPKRSSRFEQPSKDDINAMRTYTRPWEQRARDIGKLKADPSQNPVLAHQGNIIEARNKWHNDRKSAYQQLTASKDYQGADPIAQMDMDDKFESDWRSKNPDHLQNAMKAHHEAHVAGAKGHELHAAAKDAKIKNVLDAGMPGAGETFSTEAGLQHAGGTKGEEGTQGTIVQDPAASFAMGNQEFINQYAKDYSKKAKKVSNIDDMTDYDEGSKRDIERILGPAQAKDSKFEQFFSHYYPLIGMSAHKALNKLGLDPKHPDVDMSMLHEAGMHGLVQAINDYDHENPSKASFSTHAGNKIRGLQLTALKNQDKIPTEIRQAQKKFANQPAPKAAPTMSSPKTSAAHGMISQSTHPKAADMVDRMKRIGAQRQVAVLRRKPIGGQDGNN